MVQANVVPDLQGRSWELLKAEFGGLCEDMAMLRRSSRTNTTGRVLAFVRGLRFSARLIYAVRDILPAGLTASWGHILDQYGVACSPECDVIIHRDERCQHWNERKDCVMDYRFVPHNMAIAVISCKTRVTSVDAIYRMRCQDYVDQVLLFAETCGPRSVAKLTQKAVAEGYAGFWYLCTEDTKGFITKREDSWMEFAQYITSLTPAN